MNFGNYALTEPVEYRFEKEPEWLWMIKPVTARDELEMSRFVALASKRETPLTWLESAIHEIAICFAGTNILGEDGEPILKENARITAVEDVLKDMPIEMVTELWRAVGEANPLWGPPKPRQAETDTSSSES